MTCQRRLINERGSDAKPTWMTEGTASRHSHMHGYSSDQSEQKETIPHRSIKSENKCANDR